MHSSFNSRRAQSNQIDDFSTIAQALHGNLLYIASSYLKINHRSGTVHSENANSSQSSMIIGLNKDHHNYILLLPDDGGPFSPLGPSLHSPVLSLSLSRLNEKISIPSYQFFLGREEPSASLREGIEKNRKSYVLRLYMHLQIFCFK